MRSVTVIGAFLFLAGAAACYSTSVHDPMAPYPKDDASIREAASDAGADARDSGDAASDSTD